MGADTFSTIGNGKTAKEAFADAVETARFNHGHAGYTGTIAEKSAFTLIEAPATESARDFADSLLDADDERVSDKWGPAGCIKLGGDEWLFFGWASC